MLVLVHDGLVEEVEEQQKRWHSPGMHSTYTEPVHVELPSQHTSHVLRKQSNTASQHITISIQPIMPLLPGGQ